jgi:hypothetical protein
MRRSLLSKFKENKRIKLFIAGYLLQALLSERQLTWSTPTKIQSYFGGHFEGKQGLRCGRKSRCIRSFKAKQ